MNLQTCKNIVRMLRTHGLRRTLRSLVQRASERYHDWRLGIDTSHVIQPAEAGVGCADANEYVPTDYCSFRRVMSDLDIHDDDVFLDLGSGMGRALVMAAWYPFRRVLGVEYSPGLNRAAEANIRRALPAARRTAVSTAVADASRYDVPDDVTVVYFFNSFRGETFASALCKIRESLDRTPRRLRLICNVPFLSTNIEERVRACGWMKKVVEFPFPPTTRYFIYESRVPPSSASGDGQLVSGSS